jgi:hypothetical protein
VAEVVHDHAQPVGPVAVPVPDEQVAGGGDGTGTLAQQEVSPRFIAAAKRRAQARRAVRAGAGENAIDVEAALAAAARAARADPRDAVRRAPRLEGRPAAVAGIDEVVSPKLT